MWQQSSQSSLEEESGLNEEGQELQLEEGGDGGLFIQEAPDAADGPPVQESGVEEGENIPSDVDAALQEDVVVSVDETGFTPASVTVAKGTIVTFVNNGQAPHWPASDPHPTHTALSGFDSDKGLATGETYSFVFDVEGTWGYHDHLDPRLTGTVIVE